MSTSGRYIPPALRNKTNNTQEKPPTKLYHLGDIAGFFGHHDLPPSRRSSAQSKNGSGEDHSNDATTAEQRRTDAKTESELRGTSTLNDKCGENGKLAYILLYHFAHPFWTSKKEIFCKTNLDLLKGLPAVDISEKGDDEATEPASDDISYPVFSQADRVQNFTFKFEGFYKIQSIRYLQPKSDELIAYLEAKFRNKNRQPEAWKASLSTTWAVLTMEKDDSRDDEVFNIPTVPAAEKRGVNEMLAEMRIGKGGK